METGELECGLCTHSTALSHQEPISMEYKFTHEWKDKCLAEKREMEREGWRVLAVKAQR